MNILDLMEEHVKLFEFEQKQQEERTDGCTCRVQMVNTSTTGMYLTSDTYGCPLHCQHQGINTYGEWWCACGASHESQTAADTNDAYAEAAAEVAAVAAAYAKASDIDNAAA